MAGFTQNQGSRVFHVMMIVPAGIVLLLLSVISLSTLADTNQKFLDEYDSKEPDGEATCILYAESGDSDNYYYVRWQESNSCTFSVAGGGLLAALAVGFTAVLVVKAIMGVSVVSLTAMIELIMSAVGALWALIVASVITAGLNTTCQAYGETFKDFEVDHFPCCSYFYQLRDDRLGDSSNVYFYEGINASRVAAWFAMALLVLLAVVYGCIVGWYFFGGGKGKSSAKSTSEKSGPV
jgi:hypothetical protein